MKVQNQFSTVDVLNKFTKYDGLENITLNRNIVPLGRKLI